MYKHGFFSVDEPDPQYCMSTVPGDSTVACLPWLDSQAGLRDLTSSQYSQ